MEQIHTLGYPINLSKGEKCLQCYVQNWNFRKKKLSEFIQKRFNFLIQKRKTISRLELSQKESQKIKLFQLFKRIANHLDLPLTYP